jgi:UDPglucose 6-dehydrogenase
MKLAVIGTGYVGLVAGTCFSETGNEVVCVDIDEAKIAMLQQGKIPIYEPGLEEMVRRNAEEQRLIFTTDVQSAVQNSAIIFIAVGTPQGLNGHANLDYVHQTAKSIAKAMDGFKIIVTKSTVPVGTADQIRQWMSEETSQPFAVLSNPEFMKEGAAVEDFMKPDRVILGGDDPEALETVKELYEPFLRTGNQILVMDSRSAEMSKYAANAMLATKISFINEVSRLCEHMGADIIRPAYRTAFHLPRSGLWRLLLSQRYPGYHQHGR